VIFDKLCIQYIYDPHASHASGLSNEQVMSALFCASSVEKEAAAWAA
jgi:hypothetical protein